MEQPPTRKFYLRNLDCASCAAKLENGLRRLPGVEEAVLNFATLTLRIRARDMALVHEAVRRTEPGVELIPVTETMSDPLSLPAYRFSREMVFLCAAAVLFGLYWTLEMMEWQPRWPAAIGLPAYAAYLLAGWNVLVGAARNLRRGAFFDENMLMTIATLGAIAIGAVSEAVAVMLFYKIGEMLQELAVTRSRRSVGALLAARPDRAMVRAAEGLRAVPPDQVSTGETIVIPPGEKIPLDGIVLSGHSQVDTSPLTGESMPKSVYPGETVMAGSINLSAALTVEVTKPFVASSIARILDLVRNATDRKANTEKLITTFARYYTPAVVLAAALIAVVPPLLIKEAAFATWVYRALVLLVISCPCALVISIPLSYFAGIGHASRQGILVKGSNFLDILARVKTVVFDKTGTLTQGVFEVEKVHGANGYTPDQVLAFAAAGELHSIHPLGTSIVKAYAAQGGQLDANEVTDHQILPGCGIRARWKGRSILVGNDALLHRENVPHAQCAVEGTVAHVTVDGLYAGYVIIGDQLKPFAREAMAELRANGVARLVMLTGDGAQVAEKVARQLGLDQYFAGLLPEDKLRHFTRIAKEGDPKGTTAFVGDGINDAPVLAGADVGVAMGALGSAAAIETADVVLMTDAPRKMAQAIAIARRTRRIVWQNIGLALGVKIVFVGLGAFGMASMWEAVFADMGTALAAVVNATRALGKIQSSS
jgi:Cd2+/Zn2+-exporting ATPase